MQHRVIALVISYLAALLISGCSTATMNYTPYEGAQQQWSTQQGTFVRMADGVPIYEGWPSKPYSVLGRIVTVDGNDRLLALCAKTNHADAVVLVSSEVRDAGTVYFPGTTVTSYTRSGITTSGTPGRYVPVSHVIQNSWLVNFTPP